MTDLTHATQPARTRTSTGASASHPQTRRSPLRWIAILATLAFAGFLSLFSFDQPLLSIGFLMQNIPTIIVLIGAGLAWHRAWMGAAWLGCASIAALIWFPPLRDHLDWFLVINVPPMALAVMLAIDAMRNRR